MVPSFYIKIQNESRSGTFLKANGNSGKLYNFKWDGVLRAYTFYPTSQAEVDDLYRTMGRTTAYIFAPVSYKSLDLPAPIHDVPPVSVKVKLPATAQQQELLLQALHRGVVVTEDDSEDTVKRLIAAYDKGVAHTLAAKPVAKPRKSTPRAPRKPKEKENQAAPTGENQTEQQQAPQPPADAPPAQ